jgi:hypothetical protein
LESTIIGEFDTRRDAELAVEHSVQDLGVARSDFFVQPASGANMAGTRPAGAVAKAVPKPEGASEDGKLARGFGDFNGDGHERIAATLKGALWTK